MTWRPSERMRRWGSSAARGEADEPLGQAKPCAGRNHDHVAAKDDPVPGAEGVAVHGRDGRFEEGVEAVIEAPAAELTVHEGLLAAPLIFGDVGSGGEGLFARSGHDDDAHVRVGFRGIKRGAKFMKQGGRRRVQLLRPVERQNNEAVLRLVEQDERHGF